MASDAEFRVVCSSVFEWPARSGNIGLIQERASHKRGLWTIPGGRLEQFVGFGQCAVDEALEEGGVIVNMLGW